MRIIRGRRMLVLIMSLVALAVAACTTSSSGGSGGSGGSGSTDKASASSSGTIAFLLPNTSAIQFTTIAPQAFSSEVKANCASCKVLQYNANGSAPNQLAQAQAAMTQGAKVLVLQAFDAASMAGVVQTAKAKGVKVIDFDVLIPKAPVAYYVTFDPIAVGQRIAQGLVDGMRAQGTLGKCVAVLQGDPTDSNTATFWKGSEPVLKKAGIHICYTSTTPGWAAAPARTEMDAAITKIGKQNIGGVYAMDDDLATGAVASLVHAGFTTMPTITGQNGDVAAVQRILAGRQYMTVWKNVGTEASTAAKLAVQLLHGQAPTTSTTVNNGSSDIASILLPSTTVVKSNIKSTVVAANYVKPSALCAGEYASLCRAEGIGG